MGQYYKAVCLDTKQRYTPYGIKLMEHSYLTNGSILAISILLHGDNEWAGKRIVWAGDYGKGVFESSFPDFMVYRKEYEGDNYQYGLYDIASTWFEELGVIYDYSNGMSYEEYHQLLDRVTQNTIDNGAADIQYFVNEDRKEYVDLADSKCDNNKNSSIHPLPILCSYGCGEGGGDYIPDEKHPSVSYIGLWAGDRIRAYKKGEEDFLKRYKLITPGFTEER